MNGTSSELNCSLSYVSVGQSSLFNNPTTFSGRPENSCIFSDAKVLLGTPGAKQTQHPVRLVGYTIDDKTYWIATDRFDQTAEQAAFIY